MLFKRLHQHSLLSERNGRAFLSYLDLIEFWFELEEQPGIEPHRKVSQRHVSVEHFQKAANYAL